MATRNSKLAVVFSFCAMIMSATTMIFVLCGVSPGSEDRQPIDPTSALAEEKAVEHPASGGKTIAKIAVETTENAKSVTATGEPSPSRLVKSKTAQAHQSHTSKMPNVAPKQNTVPAKTSTNRLYAAKQIAHAETDKNDSDKPDGKTDKADLVAWTLELVPSLTRNAGPAPERLVSLPKRVESFLRLISLDSFVASYYATKTKKTTRRTQIARLPQPNPRRLTAEAETRIKKVGIELYIWRDIGAPEENTRNEIELTPSPGELPWSDPTSSVA